jgi:predicted TIM-barrel fold metal-dependent hydrolase
MEEGAMAASGNGSGQQLGAGDAAGEKVVIVSCDTHIGPRLREDLRPYCPKKYLDDYDDFVAYVEANAGPRGFTPTNDPTDGHWDPHERIRDLNADGTAAEVIFHGSQNGMPVPFIISDPSVGTATMGRKYDVDYEHAAVGRHMYNQWLADFCSVEPERHVGLAHLPMWDIEATIKEVIWAKEAGLRAVNFPVESSPATDLLRSRFGGLHYYNDPIWEPFWSVCEETGMQLVSHGGAGDPQDLPGGTPVWISESREIARRPMHRMIFSGVFERHPSLKMVLTELPGDWWRVKLNDMDSLAGYGGTLLSMKPSEYARRNVFLGASFQARFEALDAVEHDYWQNIIWGTDYPHIEGTWRRPGEGETPQSHLSMRYTYHDLPADTIKAMVGLTGVNVYGLDGDALHQIAQRINAPTVEEIQTPIDEIPPNHGMWAFRQFAAFG